MGRWLLGLALGGAFLVAIQLFSQCGSLISVLIEPELPMSCNNLNLECRMSSSVSSRYSSEASEEEEKRERKMRKAKKQIKK